MYYGNNNNNNGNWNGNNGNNNNRFGGQPDLSNMVQNRNPINYNNIQQPNLNSVRINNNFNNAFANNRNNMANTSMNPAYSGRFKYTAYQIIQMINNEVNRQFTERVTGKEVTELLENLQSEGYLKIIGKGTNRTVFEFVVDDRDVKHACGINLNEPMVYKVPIQVALGRVANNREALTTSIINRYLEDPKMSNQDFRESLVYLANVLPFKTIIPGTSILAITKCIPIEFSDTILDLARKQNVDVTSNGIAGELRAGDSDFQIKSGIGNVIRNYIVHDKQGNKMARKLLDNLNKFFVVADMNPDFSPFNFGFINVKGKLYLTSLDLGAALPRIKNIVKCERCGNDLVPIYPWDEVIEQSERNTLKTEGLFRCTNPDCSHGRPSIYKDTEVIEQARQALIEDIMKTGRNYDILDKI